MIIEAFERPDGMWSFRRIAMLGVQQDDRAYPSCEAAVKAANAEYPNEAVSIIAFQSQEQDMKPDQTAKPEGKDPTATNPATAGSGAVEPSTEDQVDIANQVQDGIKQADAREDKSSSPPTRVGGAKPLDGNPNPERDTEGGVFTPADDTPAVLRKRAGPRS
ncbi:Uncharacterised protein [Achromobacter spanius]|uniref:hypothetical protein n=1 Tax=Achromobacter spanius TaxID=217203 RepID=UPI000C2C441D|nr:hypothetical protein [Achromobacter spanius]AUA59115.1 hypothetical protein CVS48_25760 [Achromobacter spanius]CAB3707413.1 hypothetical protein LMG5911_05335 [Achromobacter spanius]SPT40544.1 Uncharacterised protein [Achromobacter denitrificans]VEE58700.1 Uncharacterised protein [Achromobacter spanius]